MTVSGRHRGARFSLSRLVISGDGRCDLPDQLVVGTDALEKDEHLRLHGGASLGALVERLDSAVRSTANGRFTGKPAPTATAPA